ncbi:MAG: hypothetical protein M1816_002376 [Peltula sp. TS41687]|nr:MAG: hypothetical protein M1816_002376 [Peltula sp. TS41687]
MLKFLTEPHMSEAEIEPLHYSAFAADSVKRGLFLLRGLIAGEILIFALKHKRWQVNYGLHPTQTMAAVPYRAKDSPATRAEFAQPDVTIALTCLSYYYGGLSDKQLQLSFVKLLVCDHAEEEYDSWCSQQVFPLLRFAKGAIDFYMSQVVFPKEMKEFPHQLSALGWDIAREKIQPTTGFNGTNDSSLNAEYLLKIITEAVPPVRVIIDVGAQVLKLQNKQVAEAWLARVPASQAQAAIYFNDKNELTILSRTGISEPLMLSPFAKQLDQCLVYLEEAHTRGTDLKLPTDYRAAVTLGPGLTKNRFVQAYMRMRKLRNLHPQEKKPITLGNSRDATSASAYGMVCIIKHRRQRIFQTFLQIHLEVDTQSLQDRCGFGGKQAEEETLWHSLEDRLSIKGNQQLEAIRAKCREFEVVSLNSAALQEEQKRKLSLESGRKQEVERPSKLTPCEHMVHTDFSISYPKLANLKEVDRNTIAEHPLDSSLDDLQDALQKAQSVPATDTVSAQGAQKTIAKLLGSLLLSDAASHLSSRTGNRNVASDLFSLRQRVQKGEFNYKDYRALVRLVIQKASDIDIWGAVFNLILSISRPTPPASVPPTFEGTPVRHSSQSLQHDTPTRIYVEARNLEEIKDCTYRNVDGFFAKYFEGKAWSERTMKIYETVKSRHINGRWTDFPNPPVQDDVITWWLRFQENFLPAEQRVYCSSAKRDLTGRGSRGQLDLFIESKHTHAPGKTHDWKDVEVVGELRESNND